MWTSSRACPSDGFLCLTISTTRSRALGGSFWILLQSCSFSMCVMVLNNVILNSQIRQLAHMGSTIKVWFKHGSKYRQIYIISVVSTKAMMLNCFYHHFSLIGPYPPIRKIIGWYISMYFYVWLDLLDISKRKKKSFSFMINQPNTSKSLILRR